MLVDLQVHVGESGLPLQAALDRAAAIGLDGIVAVADDAVPKLPAQANGSVRVFAGAVVSTDRGLYLTFFRAPNEVPSLEELFGPRRDGVWPVRDVMARTHAIGGAVVAVAPYDPTVAHPGGDILYTLPSLAAVQSISPAHPAAPVEPAIEAAECLGLPCVGGSGARHSVEEIGRGATLFAQALQNEQELVNALLAGACWPVEFSAPPTGLMQRGRGVAPPPKEASAGGPPPSAPAPEGERRRRRRRR
jgi:hypothetical protein